MKFNEIQWKFSPSALAGFWGGIKKKPPLAIVQKKNLTPTPWGSSWTLRANFRENSAKIRKKNENTRKHAKSRTTAKNIAYRTNHWPVGA